MSFSRAQARALGLSHLLPPVRRRSPTPPPATQGLGLLRPGREGDPTAWVVELPGLLTSLNKLLNAHHHDCNQIKKREGLLIAKACMVAGVTLAHGKRRVSQVRVIRPGVRRADPDNLWKSLLDGLRHCGALIEDHEDAVELGPVRHERGAVAMTRITIEEIEG